jgi:hypothetical protein
MNRDRFCIVLAKHISEVVGTKICPTEVSEQLMLINSGCEPTNELIGTYVRKALNGEF